MIRLTDTRVWTSLVVAALAILPIRHSFSAISFGLNDTSLSEQNVHAKLDSLTQERTVGLLARREIYRVAPGPDAAAAIESLSAMLALAPMASATWLELAYARRTAGSGIEQVVASLALSNLTGPNEARLMTARVIFALPLWSALPPDSRSNIVADIVGGWPFMDDSFRKSLRFIVANLSQHARQEFRAMLLLLGGKSAVGVEAYLKLKSDSAESPASENSAPSR